MRTRKIYVTFLVTVFSIIKFQAQTLQVNPISQRNNLWCWAAAMEMIFNYHNVSVNQCDISSAIVSNAQCINFCPANCREPIGECGSGLCDNKFSEIFNHFCFNSTYSSGTMITWTQINRQITKKTPFIIGVYDPGNPVDCSDPCSFSHYVVGKGSIIRNGKKFIRVNDPYIGCNGIFIELVSYNTPLNKPCSFIYNIKKQSGCVTPNIKVFKQTDSSMIFFDTFDDSLCSNTIIKSIKDDELNSFKKSKLHQVVPVNYIYLKNGKFSSTAKVIDVISTEKCKDYNVITRFQKINDVWEPIYIMNQIDNPVVTINSLGKTIVLSNKKIEIDSNVMVLPYEKVIFPPQPYEFYRYRVPTILPNKKIIYTTFYTPANIDDKVFIKDNVFVKGESYPRKEFINAVIKDFYAKNSPLKLNKYDFEKLRKHPKVKINKNKE